MYRQLLLELRQQLICFANTGLSHQFALLLRQKHIDMIHKQVPVLVQVLVQVLVPVLVQDLVPVLSLIHI